MIKTKIDEKKLKIMCHLEIICNECPISSKYNFADLAMTKEKHFFNKNVFLYTKKEFSTLQFFIFFVQIKNEAFSSISVDNNNMTFLFRCFCICEAKVDSSLMKSHHEL